MKKKLFIIILIVISHAGTFYLAKRFFFTETGEDSKVIENNEISSAITTPEKDKNGLLIEAEKYFGMKDYDGVIERCSEIIKIDPKSDKAYYGMGLAYFGKGDGVNAVENLRKAIDLNGSNYESYYALAGIYRAKNLHGEAIRHLEKAIEIRPDFFNAHFTLGVLNFEEKNFQNAIDNFKEVIRLSPTHVDGYVNLGKAYLKTEKINKAHENFRRAIQICKYTDPEYAGKLARIFKVIPQENMAERYYVDGVNFLNSKRINEAIRCFKKAIYHSKDSDRIFAGYAHRKLGEIYIQQYEFEEAIETLNTAIEISPDDADAYAMLGDAHIASSDADKAEKNYKMAYELYLSHGKKGRAKIVWLHKLSNSSPAIDTL